MTKPLLFIVSVAFTTSLLASTGSEISKEFNISASDKVSSIWERIFVSKKYKKLFPRSKRSLYLEDFKKLSDREKEKLKNYLIEHAADSAKPKLAGDL